MGNLCGKESADPFSQPGRILSSAPANTNTNTNNPTSSVPRKVGGPPRTLGSNSNTAQTDSQKEDARRKAAEAAEVSRKTAIVLRGTIGSCDIWEILFMGLEL
jgi:hypothetical protein